ncbi:cytochrome b/b6 domain-containing protein [Sphingopyxis indica]|nr:cytochrome b/b6 domain-containing protein [Sphingopyxis indica]
MARSVHGDTFTVWDAPLRLFHWLLVAAIAVAFLSSEGDNPIAAWHIAAGWIAAVLLVFRLVWGFIGGEHARFANFLRPSGLFSHIRELMTGHPERTIGHNPLGALAVVVLLIVTGAVLWTGIRVDAGQPDEDLHETLAYGLLALIAIHVAAVVLMSVLTRENLARAMVTGRKSLAQHPGARDARGPGAMALLLAAAVIVATTFGVLRYDPAAFVPHAPGDAKEGHEIEGKAVDRGGDVDRD